MNNVSHLIHIATLIMLVTFLGCKADGTSSTEMSAKEISATKPAAKSKLPAIRIDAGATAASTDSKGNAWLADTGFADGSVIDRGAEMAIANTADPAIYRTERYGMTAFAHPVPNGKYDVKLHFAETSSAISAPGERVFSMNVEGKELNDFDVWQRANGRERAHVETVKGVEVTDGKLDITFTAKTQNPEINGIEIVPAHR